MGEWMDGYLTRLSEVRTRNLSGGGNQYEALQHGLGKRSAREPIFSVLGPGTFEEMGSLVTDTRKPFVGRPGDYDLNALVKRQEYAIALRI